MRARPVSGLDDGSPSTRGVDGTYTGDWDASECRPHGWGAMAWENGITYEGEWSDGRCVETHLAAKSADKRLRPQPGRRGVGGGWHGTGHRPLRVFPSCESYVRSRAEVKRDRGGGSCQVKQRERGGGGWQVKQRERGGGSCQVKQRERGGGSWQVKQRERGGGGCQVKQRERGGGPASAPTRAIRHAS